MPVSLKRLLRIISGTVFIILGILGLFLPILQGFLFLGVGLLILAPESKRPQRLKHRLELRFPSLFNQAHRIMSWLNRSIHRTPDKSQTATEHNDMRNQDTAV